MNDSIIGQVGAAAQALQAQDKARARAILTPLWAGLDAAARPDLACVAAHYLADAMEDLQDELAWDERALEAADAALAAGMATLEGVGSIQAFYPSLHLNLGDGYLRAGDLETCQRHLSLAQQALPRLPGEGAYSAMVRKGIDGLEQRLEQALGVDGS